MSEPLCNSVGPCTYVSADNLVLVVIVSVVVFAAMYLRLIESPTSASSAAAASTVDDRPGGAAAASATTGRHDVYLQTNRFDGMFVEHDGQWYRVVEHDHGAIALEPISDPTEVAE